MASPFVSRATHDALQRKVDALQSALDRERERYDALLAQTLAMKREGFVAQEPRTPVTAPTPKSKVHKTIEAVAGTDWKLRKHLADYASTEAAKGESDETIIQRIVHWETYEEGDEDAVDDFQDAEATG